MNCQHCTAKTSGEALCAQHAALLTKVLGNVRTYYVDLETLRTKQTRYGDAGKGSIGKTMPLGVDLRFARVRTHVCEPTCGSPCPREGVIVEGQATAAEQVVRSLVVTWGRIVLAAHSPIAGPVCVLCLHRTCASIRRSRRPHDNVPSVLAYLLDWARWIASQDWAGAILAQLLDAETTLSRLVDRPAGQWYAGPCNECGADLYATEGSRVVVCRACDWEYDVAPRRDWLLAAAEDQLLPAAALSRAVSWLGAQPLTADRIRQWKKRGKITAYPERCEHCRKQPVVRPCPMDTPLYRVGDAIDLIADHAAAAAKGA